MLDRLILGFLISHLRPNDAQQQTMKRSGLLGREILPQEPLGK